MSREKVQVRKLMYFDLTAIVHNGKSLYFYTILNLCVTINKMQSTYKNTLNLG